MNGKRVFYCEVAYVLGLVVLAVGTALMEKADFGMSMVVAPAYLLYLKLNPNQREEVLRILSETPGRIPVVLVEVSDDGTKKAMQAPESYWVDEGYDFGALVNLIGVDSVVLK